MASVIERVEAFEPHIAATWLYAPERALGEARASETRWMRNEPVGPLDGVPATVKDNIATRGDPTPVGTAASDMTPAEADAPPAARLKEAGAIIFAKTTMPDYGMLSSGLSSHHPLARNPWRLDRNPGGSSAGAGAAAAAHYGPLHVGTDIGGSVRLPAGWCGSRRPQAERRARADRPALYRPGRRPDDARRRRRGPDDGDADPAGRTRLREPELRDARLDDPPGRPQGAAASASCSRRAAAFRRRARCARRSSGRRAISRRPARGSSRSRRSLPRRCSTASTISGGPAR